MWALTLVFQIGTPQYTTLVFLLFLKKLSNKLSNYSVLRVPFDIAFVMLSINDLAKNISSRTILLDSHLPRAPQAMLQIISGVPNFLN